MAPPLAGCAISFTRQPVNPVDRTRQFSPNFQDPNSSVSPDPTLPNPESSGTMFSHRISETQSLQTVPPRLIRALIPKWYFIDDRPHPAPPRHPTLASAVTPASIIPCPPFLHHPSTVSTVPQTHHSPPYSFSYATFPSFICLLCLALNAAVSTRTYKVFRLSEPSANVGPGSLCRTQCSRSQRQSSATRSCQAPEPPRQ